MYVYVYMRTCMCNYVHVHMYICVYKYITHITITIYQYLHQYAAGVKNMTPGAPLCCVFTCRDNVKWLERERSRNHQPAWRSVWHSFCDRPGANLLPPSIPPPTESHTMSIPQYIVLAETEQAHGQVPGLRGQYLRNSGGQALRNSVAPGKRTMAGGIATERQRGTLSAAPTPAPHWHRVR